MIQTEKYTFPTPNRGFFLHFSNTKSVYFLHFSNFLVSHRDAILWRLCPYRHLRENATPAWAGAAKKEGCA